MLMIPFGGCYWAHFEMEMIAGCVLHGPLHWVLCDIVRDDLRATTWHFEVVLLLKVHT